MRRRCGTTSRIRRTIPSFRQLLHVGFKIAAKMGPRYLEALEANEDVVAQNVTDESCGSGISSRCFWGSRANTIQMAKTAALSRADYQDDWLAMTRFACIYSWRGNRE